MSDFTQIPDELQARDQWLFWNASNDTPRAPLDSPAATYGCSWSDPDTWLSFEDVASGASETPNAGIGYVNAADNDDYARGIYGVIDLDGVADADGSPKDWVPSLQPFFDRDAYCEWSPSGEGIHIPVAGIEVPDWWSDQHFTDDDHEGVEVLTNKFSTFTGDVMRGCEDATIVDYGPWLDEWLREAYMAVTGEDPIDDHSGTTTAKDDSRSRAGGSQRREWLDQEAVEDALDHIDPNCGYTTWRNIGFALADHFDSHTARKLFDSWSRGAGSKYDDDAESLIDDIANRGSGGITIATLVHHATEAGWSPSPDAPPLDVVADDGADESAAEDVEQTDGGVAVDDSPTPTATTTFEDEISYILTAVDAGDIQAKTARHRIALALNDEYDFAYPERDVRGWRTTLYVYNDREGIYEPRGENVVKRELERVAGDYITNTVTNEIVGKLERMSIARGDRFETAPNRLVVANGILDLHTGELDDWTPAELHRTKLDVAWAPDAGDPDAIDDFLHDIVEPRDVDTLYRLIAHTIYKEYAAEKAAMLVGGGQNGKSVFLDLIERFLGETNVAHRALQDFDDNQFAANQLEGKLANIHPDMGDESVTDMSTFKKLTGRDTMTADVKYETPVTFENYATLMFAANEMPVFSEDNHAVWRRWVYVSFPNTFDANDEEAHDPVPKRVLMRRLTATDELEGLLVRCQREIQAWYEGRDWYPDAMDADEVREQMKKAAEPVFDFATTCLRDVDDDAGALPKDAVREAYREYATEEGLPKMGHDRFGERLMNLSDYNITSARVRENGERTRVYKGLQWTERGRQVLGLDDPDDEAQSQVGDTTQRTAIVLEHVRELVANNDHEPVDESMVIGRAMGDMTMTAAENAIDELKTNGRIYDSGDGLIDT